MVLASLCPSRFRSPATIKRLFRFRQNKISGITLHGRTGAAPNSEKAARRLQRIEEELAELGERGKILLDLSMAGKDLVDQQGNSLVDPKTIDDKIWAILIGLGTAAILFVGRYSLIEVFSVALVVAFTFITVGNVAALQGTTYAISGQDFLYGLSFHLPDTGDWNAALVTAFATFGIIGVGATELISYPYWCLEKGYARSAGPRTMDESWVRRAQGWFHVMKWDAFTSMVIYTAATAAFYLMGVAVLHAEGRNPEGMHGEHVGSQLCADLRRICEVVVPVRSGGGAVFDISCRQRGQCPHDR